MRFSNILTRIKKGYFWSQALHLFQGKEYAGAFAYYSKYSKLKTPNPFDVAFEATLCVGLNQSVRARTLFDEIQSNISETCMTESAKHTYLWNYSKMYLSLIDNDDMHAGYLRNASAVDVPKDIQDTLPLPLEADLKF